MKYITPKYDLTMLETEDILLASSTGYYEIEEKGDGSGNVIMIADDLFR